MLSLLTKEYLSNAAKKPNLPHKKTRPSRTVLHGRTEGLANWFTIQRQGQA
jgi:hypothetical protein